MNCEACEGYGFLLMNSDGTGLEIQRCDACELFAGDSDATEYVYTLAKRMVDKVNQMW